MRREGAVRRLTGSRTLPQDGAALGAYSIHTSNKANTFKLHRLWMQAWLQNPRLLSCACSWSRGCQRRAVSPAFAGKRDCACVWQVPISCLTAVCCCHGLVRFQSPIGVGRAVLASC